jgi:hypothetical protein
LPDDRYWDDATYDNVAFSLDRWRTECDKSASNIAVLYVGAHGAITTKDAAYAFLSKSNEGEDQYRYSINLRSVQKRMGRFCKARTNIYIFDCCAVRDGLPEVSEGQGLTIGRRTGVGKAERVSQVVIAARDGTNTYSLKRRGTLLTWALLGDPEDKESRAAFRYAGELTKDAKFVITPHQLSRQLATAMKECKLVPHADGEEPIIRPPRSKEGIAMPDPPKFRVTLRRRGEDRGEALNIVVRDRDGVQKFSGSLKGDVLILPALPAGIYTSCVNRQGSTQTYIRDFSVDAEKDVWIWEAGFG